MLTIRGLKRQLVPFNLPIEIVHTIEQTAGNIIDLNQKQLYNSSEDSLGKKLSLYSSPLYALEKEELNPKPGFFHPDLYYHGDFYFGFKVTVGFTGIFTIESTDSKAPKLEQQYGKQIFGLTPYNKAYYATGAFYEALKARITQQTGLKFK